eukprot:7861325-Alexandrium_andersonii.AAC.1
MWHDGSSSGPVVFLTKMGDAAVLESDLLGWKVAPALTYWPAAPLPSGEVLPDAVSQACSDTLTQMVCQGSASHWRAAARV